MSIVLTVSTALLSLALQASGGSVPAGVPEWVSVTEHLGLTGALLVAVAILWKSYQAKDEQAVRSAAEMTRALTETASASMELRGIIKESVAANIKIRESLDSLSHGISTLTCGSDRPCGQEQVGRRHGG